MKVSGSLFLLRKRCLTPLCQVSYQGSESAFESYHRSPSRTRTAEVVSGSIFLRRKMCLTPSFPEVTDAVFSVPADVCLQDLTLTLQVE